MECHIKVSNPLTIIAIFAGLAETLATVALVKLPPEIQSIFVYFVMAFPAVIVLLFFFVLYFKNIVLYAPSDFENQDHYLEANEIKQSISFELDKIFTKINKDGKKLTQNEIDKAKSSVEKTVDTITSMSPREKSILDFMGVSAVTSTEISNEFKIHRVTALKYLCRMEDKEIVRKNNGKWVANI